MHIGLDFDGVIADTFPLKAKYAKELFGVDLDPAYSKEWHVVEKGLLTKEQYRSLAEFVCKTETGLEMPPVEDALETLKKLLEEGHTFKVITSRDEEEAAIAKKWCGIQGLSIPIHSVGYGISKAEAVADVVCYIDDDYEKLLPLKEVGPTLFLLTAPHNTETSLDTFVTRADSWNAFYEHIQKLP